MSRRADDHAMCEAALDVLRSMSAPSPALSPGMPESVRRRETIRSLASYYRVSMSIAEQIAAVRLGYLSATRRAA